MQEEITVSPPTTKAREPVKQRHAYKKRSLDLGQIVNHHFSLKIKECGQWRCEQNCFVGSKINESVPGNQTLSLWKLSGPGFSIFYVLFSISCFKRMELEEMERNKKRLSFFTFHFHLSLKRKMVFEFWDVPFPLRQQQSSSAQLSQLLAFS